MHFFHVLRKPDWVVCFCLHCFSWWAVEYNIGIRDAPAKLALLWLIVHQQGNPGPPLRVASIA